MLNVFTKVVTKEEKSIEKVKGSLNTTLPYQHVRASFLRSAFSNSRQ